MKFSLQDIMSPSTNKPQNHTTHAGGYMSKTAKAGGGGAIAAGKFLPEADRYIVDGVGGGASSGGNKKQTRRRR